ncbi:MAG: response regulator [Chloroflexi bacterium]|nr:response regulator [Chloroflexota bacterium]MBP8056553.1 response regulator [Chloroflexota bacterium]
MAEKLLVVDDHLETREAIVMTLEGSGYVVLAAESGMEALNLFESHKPDIVLLDISMPDMNGYEVCRQIRAHATLGKVPVIMFSANDDAMEKLAGFNAGADDYLVKPTRSEELLSRVETILARANRLKTMANTLTDATTIQHTEQLNFDAWLPQEEVKQPFGLIAVLGARGGSGTTTTAINLAFSLADTGRETTLIDLDMLQGHVSMYLNKRVDGGINSLNNMSVERFTVPVLEYEKNLHLVLCRPNIGQNWPLLNPEQVKLLIQQCIQPGQYVVVDLGTGLSPVAEAVLAEATQILVCLKPERIAILAAKHLMAQIDRKGLAVKGVETHALMLTFGNRAELPQSAIEEFLGHSLVGMVTISAKEINQAVNEATAITRISSGGQATIAFKQLAHQFSYG